VERQIGVVIRYFPRISVGVLRLDDDLVQGEEILIRGPATNFVQTVDSMQIEHTQIPRAVKGQEIGLKMLQRVHEGDKVYKRT
jgi:putative protease